MAQVQDVNACPPLLITTAMKSLVFLLIS